MKIILLSIIGLFFIVSVQAQQLGISSSTDIADYIKAETIGGKLDFESQLEDNKLYLHDGTAYGKKDFAIFLWGKAVKGLGISSKKRAIELWQEAYRRTMTKPEKKALFRGFKAT